MIKFISESTDKQAARSILLKLRNEISETERAELNKRLFEKTAELRIFKEAETLLCYYPVRGEPDILPLARYALELGKKVAFPISHVSDIRLSFHVISNLSELTRGTYNIPEPSEAATEITDFSESLCIVPALAFDKEGHRLGYGAGYYDRFLSSFNGVSIGLAYSQFYVDKIPFDKHDASVNIIITEDGGYFL